MTNQPLVAVLDYGIGNLRSAEKALQRAGADARLVTTSADAARADGVVLPGVGAFGACMRALQASGLDRAAHVAIDSGKPFLGVCVGLQLLMEGSEESPGVPGLGVISGTVRRIPDAPKLPHMQWNRLQFTGSSPLLHGLGADPWVYFVHSYGAELNDPSQVVATADYGGPVAAVLQRERLWATQFHPEKSGQVGLTLLKNFVEEVKS